MLAEEWEKPYSIVRSFIDARMSIALVRATTRCIRGSKIPARNMSNRFRWKVGAGLGLLKNDNYFETLHVKQYLKIRAEVPIRLNKPNGPTQVPNLVGIKIYECSEMKLSVIPKK